MSSFLLQLSIRSHFFDFGNTNGTDCLYGKPFFGWYFYTQSPNKLNINGLSGQGVEEMKYIIAGLVAASVSAVSAPTIVTTQTFSGLKWDVVQDASLAAVFPGCTSLSMDFTGNLSANNGFSANGIMACTAGTYAPVGSAYISGATGGNLTFTVLIGGHTWLCSAAIGSFSGSCRVVFGSTNTGTATLTLKK